MSQPSRWPPPAPPPGYAPVPAYLVRAPLDLVLETTVAGWVTLGCAIMGVAAGFVWAALAPRLDAVAAVVDGQAAAFGTLVSDDVAFGAVALGAGVVTGLAALIVEARRRREPGPGTLVGFVIGAVVGGVVAVLVGVAARHDHIVNTVQAALPGVEVDRIKDAVAPVQFGLHSVGMVGAWALAACLVYFVGLAVRTRD